MARDKYFSKTKRAFKKFLNNSFFEKYKCTKSFAFSIAEAMVTLLIVSIALAAAAPIMSRNIKNTQVINASSVPKGAIMLFDKNTYGYTNGCPTGWTNISDGNSERFLMLNTSEKVGNTGDGYLPNHWHGIGYLKNDETAGSSSLYFISKPFKHTTGFQAQGYELNQLSSEAKDGITTADGKYQNDTVSNLVLSNGLGTTIGLYVHGNSATDKSNTNKFDLVKPKSISVIACRFDG